MGELTELLRRTGYKTPAQRQEAAEQQRRARLKRRHKTTGKESDLTLFLRAGDDAVRQVEKRAAYERSAERAKENLENRSEFMRTLLSGIDTTQATYYGGMGAIKSWLGDKQGADEDFEHYDDEMRQAGENPRTVDTFWSAHPDKGAFGSLGNFGTWAAGAAGSVLPSAAEAVLSGVAGAAAGSMLVPGPEPTDVVAAPVGFLSGLFSKTAVKKAIAETAEQYVKKGVARDAAETMATQAVRNNLSKRIAATLAVQQSTALHESGGMWGEGMEQGIDNPVSALLLGQVSGLSEAAFGVVPSGLRMFLGRTAAKEVLKKSGPRVAAGFVWDIVKKSGEEGVQEAFQEYLGSVNKSINDPDAKILTKENFMDWMEAGAVGGLAGFMFGTAGLTASQAKRLASLREARNKGEISRTQGRNLGVPKDHMKTQKDRTKFVDDEIDELNQLAADVAKLEQEREGEVDDETQIQEDPRAPIQEAADAQIPTTQTPTDDQAEVPIVEVWEKTRAQAKEEEWGDNWAAVIKRNIDAGKPVPQAVRDELTAYEAEREAKKPQPKDEALPDAKVGDTVVRYTHKGGTGLLNNSELDRSKLTDEEANELVDLMDLGLTQPPRGTTGTFYFTSEGEQKHKRMLDLLTKASKKGIIRTESVLSSEPTWQSGDGQVAVPTATTTATKTPVKPEEKAATTTATTTQETTEGPGEQDEAEAAFEQAWEKARGAVSKEVDLALNKQIDRYETQASKDEGGRGIAVGAENINYRWAADAVREFRDRVRKGVDPQQAADEVKELARTWIAEHNARRPNDINWKRADMAADSYIDTALRTVVQAKETTRQQKEAATPAAETPAETQAPEARDLTSEGIVEAWLASRDNRGFYERRETLVARMRQLVKRMELRTWGTFDELLVKNRQGQTDTGLMGRNLKENLKDLKELGVVQVAWDKMGQPYYARADRDVPNWLTQSQNDEVMQTLPERPDTPDYPKMSVDELQQLARQRDLEIAGKKKRDLIEMLEQSDAESETPAETQTPTAKVPKAKKKASQTKQTQLITRKQRVKEIQEVFKVPKLVAEVAVFLHDIFGLDLGKIQVQPQGTPVPEGSERQTPTDLWASPEQEITSEDTSINERKLPALFNKLTFEDGTLNVDIGGGRFDNVAEHLSKQGAENVVYDPFNRSVKHNKQVAKRVRDGQADTATVANVLNVIREPNNRARVIQQAANAIGADGVAYFQIYEGDGTGQGRETSKGWQENRKTADYESEIRAVFGEVKRRGNIIEARSPVEEVLHQTPRARWHSKARNIVEQKMGATGTPDQVLKMLQKNGVKPEELEWSGLEELLGSGIKKITKGEVLQAIDTSFELREVVLTEGEGLKYGEHTGLVLPGGTDHVEIAMYSPDIEQYSGEDDAHYGDVTDRRGIAWIRGNARIDADGKRVFFVEEVQSKRHQQGRKEGYRTERVSEPPRYNEWTAKPSGEKGRGQLEGQTGWDIVDEHGDPQPGVFAKTQEEALQKAIATGQAQHAEQRAKRYWQIPNAPFKKTSAWARLAMKRAIQYAAENGFDRIAWTTGEQQADRARQSSGEKMKAFYDTILPNVVNKFIKKFGAKVGQTRLGFVEGGIDDTVMPAVLERLEQRGDVAAAPSFDITPEMRESALREGQPLFQAQQRDDDGPKGWHQLVETAEGLVSKIGGTDTADISTWIHEFAHALRKHLFDRSVPEADRNGITDADLDIIEAFAFDPDNWEEPGGVRVNEWNGPAEEAFGRVFEQYWMDGIAPSKELAGVFQKLAALMREVYRGLKELLPVPPDVRGVFDRLALRGKVDPSLLPEVETETEAISDTDYSDVLDDLFVYEGTIDEEADSGSEKSAKPDAGTDTEVLLQPAQDNPRRRAALLLRDALKEGHQTFDAYVTYAIAKSDTKALEALTPHLVGVWNYLRTKPGYTNLEPAGTVEIPERPNRTGPRVLGVSVERLERQADMWGLPHPTESEAVAAQDLVEQAIARHTVEGDVAILQMATDIIDGQTVISLTQHADLIASVAHHTKMIEQFERDSIQARTQGKTKTAEDHEQTVNIHKESLKIVHQAARDVGRRQFAYMGHMLQVVVDHDGAQELERKLTIANKGTTTPEIVETAKKTADALKAAKDAMARRGREIEEAERSRHQEEQYDKNTTEIERDSTSAPAADVPPVPADTQVESTEKPVAETGPGVLAKLKDAAFDAMKRIQNRLAKQKEREDGSSLFQRPLDKNLEDAAIVAKYVIASGVATQTKFKKEMLTMLGEWVEPYLDDLYAAQQNVQKESIRDELRKTLKSAGDVRQQHRLVEKLAKVILAETRNDDGTFISRDELLRELHSELQKIDEAITRREVEDIYSRYGQYRELSKDEVDTKYREYRSEVLLLGQKRDLENKKAPAKTGSERQPYSDEARKLQKDVNRLKKEAERDGWYYEDNADRKEKRLKGHEEATATRLKNEIKDLDDQIAAGQKTVKNRSEPLTNKEIEYLKEQKKMRQQRLDAIDKANKARDAARWDDDGGHFTDPALTEYIKLLVNQINTLKQKLVTKKVFPKQAPARPGGKQVDALKAEINALNAEVELMRNVLDPSYNANKKLRQQENMIERRIAKLEKEEQQGWKLTPKSEKSGELHSEKLTKARERLETLKRRRNAALEDGYALRAAIARSERNAADMAARLASGDFAPRKRKPVRVFDDPEWKKAKMKEVAARKQLAEAIAKYEWENADPLTTTGIVLNAVNNVWKAWISGGDLGTLGLHTGLVKVTNPVVWAKALIPTAKAIKKTTHEEQDAEREANPDYERYHGYGLSLTRSGKGANTEFYGDEDVLDKIPGVAVSKRTFNTNLNEVRFNLMQILEATYTRDGRIITKEQGEALANLVNAFTLAFNPRGQGTRQAMSVVGKFFWALSMYVARLNVLVGYPIWQPGADSRVRMIAAKQYAKMLVGMTALTMALRLLLGDDESRKFFPDDDDDDALTPIDSDYWKIKSGNIRMDITAGMGQMVRFGFMALNQAAAATGAGPIWKRKKDPRGWRELTGSFASFKLAPWVQATFDTFSADSEGVKKDVLGRPTSMENILLSNITPLSLQTLIESVEEEGAAKGMAWGAVGVTGHNLSIYDRSAPRSEETLLPTAMRLLRRMSGAKTPDLQIDDFTRWKKNQLAWDTDLSTVKGYLSAEQMDNARTALEEKRQNVIWAGLAPEPEILRTKQGRDDFTTRTAYKDHLKKVEEAKKKRKPAMDRFEKMAATITEDEAIALLWRYKKRKKSLSKTVKDRKNLLRQYYRKKR